MLTLNVLFSLIIQSKRKGKGVTPNGRIFTELMLIISDFSGEESILKCFNNETVKKESYRKFERYFSRFLKDGKGYPYELFSFDNFENSIGDSLKFTEYLRKTENVINKITDVEKLESLVYTLLEIIRQDRHIRKILYGRQYIPTEKLHGSYAHKKKICAEALILGLLYHVHKNPAVSQSVELLEIPEKLTFRTIRYSDEDSLDIDMKTDIIENICENAKRSKPVKMKYQLEFECEDKVINELPKIGDLFIYGESGAGKTTLLKSLVNSDENIYFYFPLYNYKRLEFDEYGSSSFGILLDILLKYHYQYEYCTLENLVSNEGVNKVLCQLNLLEKFLCNEPFDGKRKCTLLLDGVNEISSEQLSYFFDEVGEIRRKWRNVRIIAANRNITDAPVFDNFGKIKIIGVQYTTLNEIIDAGETDADKRLYQILKLPIFLEMYAQSDNKHITRGKLLDEYIFRVSEKYNDTERFLIRYSLPFAAKKLFRLTFRRCMTRSEFLESVDESIRFYLLNDNVYQNYIVPERINKKPLLESREKHDIVDLLLNTGFLGTDENEPKYLHFVHDYYRDYFAARHIINLIETAWSVYDLLLSKLPDHILESGITDYWYGSHICHESDIVYQLIGEICEEKDSVCEKSYPYLERLLDMCRSTHGFLVTDNIIRTLKVSGNDVICGMDFSELRLPPFMYDDLKFSRNGENPCDFRKCTVPFWFALNNVDFTNCDFSGAVYFESKTRDYLAELGAIT